MFDMDAWRDYLERMRERDDNVWRVDLSADKQRIAALEAENAALKQQTATLIQQRIESVTLLAITIAERDAARQSRARLVGAVREQRELLKAARLIRAELRQEVADLTTEADAARAWAAAWRRAAHYWKAQQAFTGHAWAWTDGIIGGDEYFERTDKVRAWLYANVPAFVLDRIDKRLSDNLQRDADARRAAEALEKTR